MEIINKVNVSKTVLISKNVVDYAEKFKGFAMKTAESVIQMGKVVHDAKNTLTKEDFEVFCQEVGYDSGSSTIRKLKTIGEKYEILLGRSQSLPSTWTTMYHVARLTAEQIDEKINEGVITPHLDGKNLPVRLGLAEPTVPKGTDTELWFKVDFSLIPDLELKARLKAIMNDLKTMSAAVKPSPNLERFLQDEAESLQKAA
jgi:hypothetical protein